jgi:hypothetical protein
MRLRRCDTPAGSDINEVLYHLTRTTETDALRERLAAMAASACPRQMNNHASLSTGWLDLHCALRTQNKEPTMINDINIGGVFIPGLLLTALSLWSVRCYSCRFFFSRLYRRLPLRPLLDVSTYIVTFFLLLQGLTTLGLFA